MNKGQAKHRKDKGLMPEPSQKPRKKARIKTNPRDSMMGMGEVMMLLSALTMRGRLGETFAIRQEMARMNHEEEDRPICP